jgi:hypothetical protein
MLTTFHLTQTEIKEINRLQNAIDILPTTHESMLLYATLLDNLDIFKQAIAINHNITNLITIYDNQGVYFKNP